MSQYNTQDDPLSYEKAPSLSFKDAPIGTMFTGTITSRAKLVPARDFESGEPKTWPDGNKVETVVIMLEVDGEARSLWAQKPSAMFAALVAAQKEAGGQPMEEGGTLKVKFVGEKPNTKNPRLNPAKQYAAKYIPPAPQADVFADKPAPQTRPQTPPASPPATPQPKTDEDW